MDSGCETLVLLEVLNVRCFAAGISCKNSGLKLKLFRIRYAAHMVLCLSPE